MAKSDASGHFEKLPQSKKILRAAEHQEAIASLECEMRWRIRMAVRTALDDEHVASRLRTDVQLAEGRTVHKCQGHLDPFCLRMVE